MKNLWFTGLLFLLTATACTSVEVPETVAAPGSVSLPASEEAVSPTPDPEVTPDASAPVSGSEPALDPGVFALYRITTDPPGVGVLREGGELIGLTPLTIRLESPRAFRLTFLKKGFTIVGKFIKPEPGHRTYHLVMTPEE